MNTRVEDYVKQELEKLGADGSLNPESINALSSHLSGILEQVVPEHNDEVVKEINSMNNDFANLKQDMAQIDASPKAKEISGNQIFPETSLELNAICKATEDAVNTIMDACEEIQAITEPIVTLKSGQKIEELIIKIYEACNFQDLTGQRISKVLKALDSIESHLGKMQNLFSTDLMNIIEEANTNLDDAAEGSDMSLMNGPQLDEEAPSQDDIDELFKNV